MTTRLASLEPGLLWAHFDRLRKIPRASGEESAACEYVQAYGRERGWTVARDRVGNVCLKVPATPARAGVRCLVLQAHLDMVCEKDAAIDFDFSKYPIDAVVEGDWVTARSTTLGADNGIGVAAALAACEDPACEHGPVEVLLTVDEEATGSGAEQLDTSMIEGRLLLNLDSEDDSMMVVGCAGGCSTEIEYPAKRTQAPANHQPVRVSVRGLRGGHSGLTIHENRGNAIKLLARVLHRLLAKADLYLWSCQGGNKHNAIPRDASALVYLPRSFVERARAIVDETCHEVVSEIGATDPDLRITLEEAEAQSVPPFDCSSTRRLVRLLVALPHGVLAMSRQGAGLVETSTNLAMVATDVDRVTIVNSSRSLRASNLRFVLDQLDAISRLSGADATESAAYPPWRAEPDSELARWLQASFLQVLGKPAVPTTLHGGLECGVIARRIAGMDMLSFGPLIEGAHAPGERVNVPSVRRFYSVLLDVMARIG